MAMLDTFTPAFIGAVVLLYGAKGAFAQPKLQDSGPAAAQAQSQAPGPARAKPPARGPDIQNTNVAKTPRLAGPIQDNAYNGLVVDQTITLPGHDFYSSFVAAWRDKPLSERYAVTVGERPSLQFGSQVWIEFGRRRVFQSFLPPARARVAGIGEQAAEAAYQNIVQSEAQQLLFRDPDLGPDEI